MSQRFRNPCPKAPQHLYRVQKLQDAHARRRRRSAGEPTPTWAHASTGPRRPTPAPAHASTGPRQHRPAPAPTHASTDPRQHRPTPAPASASNGPRQHRPAPAPARASTGRGAQLRGMRGVRDRFETGAISGESATAPCKTRVGGGGVDPGAVSGGGLPYRVADAYGSEGRRGKGRAWLSN